jgi:polyisoprenoid-binding protein YceI
MQANTSDAQAANHRFAPASPLPDGVWTIDRPRSEIGFAVKAMWGLATVRGRFAAYDGRLEVRAGGATGELTIEATSLDTGNARRDRHLRSPDFFDVEHHPRLTFTATDVTPRDGGLTVGGTLGVGAARLPLQIPVTAEQMADGTLSLQGQTTVARQTAGMTWNMLGTVGDDAVLHAELTLKRVPA